MKIRLFPFHNAHVIKCYSLLNVSLINEACPGWIFHYVVDWKLLLWQATVKTNSLKEFHWFTYQAPWDIHGDLNTWLIVWGADIGILKSLMGYLLCSVSPWSQWENMKWRTCVCFDEKSSTAMVCIWIIKKRCLRSAFMWADIKKKKKKRVGYIFHQKPCCRHGAIVLCFRLLV